ncbi:MAG: GFA family protein [Allosphingosinicella sp.]|uniref:GFA family protein n=1 Tax=Allosphingosinicella sp. TaxID=2823234 RepID=UPI003940238D
MKHSGSCLCGAVAFDVEGDLPGPDACHCTMCRKHSGHVFASTDVPKAALAVRGEDKVGWYRSSDEAQRGFCTVCGSSLFWESLGRDTIAVAMGAFERPTGTHLAVHIFTADKGDYYDIADGVPQKA